VTAVDDLLDHCAQVQAGQRVLVVAAPDGLRGGRNIVDEATVASIADGVRSRGADASVLWVDIPNRRDVVWPGIPTRDTVWRIPPVLKQAMKGADILISHVYDLSNEEELKEWSETLEEYRLPMVRNMATTTQLLVSAWACTPYEWVSEIRYRVAEQIRPGERWLLTHPNGTHLEGTVGPAPGKRSAYANRRTDGFHRPFPEGIYPAINPLDARGVYIFERMLPVWAGHIGVPPLFSRPVSLTIENNRVVEIEGGKEADTLRHFLAALAKAVGNDNAYEVRAPHGGVHPCAHVSGAECHDTSYREFIASFHPSSIHIHLGVGSRTAEFPYNLHSAAEIRGATLKVGDQVLHDAGRLSVLNHPSVQAVAARYPNRPELLPGVGSDDDRGG